MRNLYDITEDLDRAREIAFSYAAENEGEIPDYIATMLDELSDEKEVKVEKIACLFKDLKNFGESIKTEQSRLTAMKKTNANEMERIKNYLEALVDEGEKFKTPRATVSWRKSTSTVLKEGVTPEDLDERYQKVKVEASLTEIAKGIKEGDEEVMELAELVTKNGITIK